MTLRCLLNFSSRVLTQCLRAWLVLALAFTRPGVWPAAILIQAGSLIACLSYFSGRGTAGPAFIPMTLGIAVLLYVFAKESATGTPHALK